MLRNFALSTHKANFVQTHFAFYKAITEMPNNEINANQYTSKRSSGHICRRKRQTPAAGSGIWSLADKTRDDAIYCRR